MDISMPREGTKKVRCCYILLIFLFILLGSLAYIFFNNNGTSPSQYISGMAECENPEKISSYFHPPEYFELSSTGGEQEKLNLRLELQDICRQLVLLQPLTKWEIRVRAYQIDTKNVFEGFIVCYNTESSRLSCISRATSKVRDVVCASVTEFKVRRVFTIMVIVHLQDCSKYSHSQEAKENPSYPDHCREYEEA
ncbi:unnamed protein product [Orchesella dallaii]|uniref:Uncharacterized protein n=1 Tax=Orchesella dallaii TaxID=48710 RepID=A0ABP1RYL7_9HEXA